MAPSIFASLFTGASSLSPRQHQDATASNASESESRPSTSHSAALHAPLAHASHHDSDGDIVMHDEAEGHQLHSPADPSLESNTSTSSSAQNKGLAVAAAPTSTFASNDQDDEQVITLLTSSPVSSPPSQTQRLPSPPGPSASTSSSTLASTTKRFHHNLVDDPHANSTSPPPTSTKNTTAKSTTASHAAASQLPPASSSTLRRRTMPARLPPQLSSLIAGSMLEEELFASENSPADVGSPSSSQFPPLTRASGEDDTSSVQRKIASTETRVGPEWLVSSSQIVLSSDPFVIGRAIYPYRGASAEKQHQADTDAAVTIKTEESRHELDSAPENQPKPSSSLLASSLKRQRLIETPDFQPRDDTLYMPKTRGLRSEASEDTSDAAYERRHRRPEIIEKRQRKSELDRLIKDRAKLVQRIEQLRSVEAKILLPLLVARDQTRSQFRRDANTHGTAEDTVPEVDDKTIDNRTPSAPDAEKSQHERIEDLRQELLEDALETLKRYDFLLSSTATAAEPLSAAAKKGGSIHSSLHQHEGTASSSILTADEESRSRSQSPSRLKIRLVRGPSRNGFESPLRDEASSVASVGRTGAGASTSTQSGNNSNRHISSRKPRTRVEDSPSPLTARSSILASNDNGKKKKRRTSSLHRNQSDEDSPGTNQAVLAEHGHPNIHARTSGGRFAPKAALKSTGPSSSVKRASRGLKKASAATTGSTTLSDRMKRATSNGASRDTTESNSGRPRRAAAAAIDKRKNGYGFDVYSGSSEEDEEEGDGEEDIDDDEEDDESDGAYRHRRRRSDVSLSPAKSSTFFRAHHRRNSAVSNTSNRIERQSHSPSKHFSSSISRRSSRSSSSASSSVATTSSLSSGGYLYPTIPETGTSKVAESLAELQRSDGPQEEIAARGESASTRAKNFVAHLSSSPASSGGVATDSTPNKKLKLVLSRTASSPADPAHASSGATTPIQEALEKAVQEMVIPTKNREKEKAKAFGSVLTESEAENLLAAFLGHTSSSTDGTAATVVAKEGDVSVTAATDSIVAAGKVELQVDVVGQPQIALSEDTADAEKGAQLGKQSNQEQQQEQSVREAFRTRHDSSVGGGSGLGSGSGSGPGRRRSSRKQQQQSFGEKLPDILQKAAAFDYSAIQYFRGIDRPPKSSSQQHHPRLEPEEETPSV